MWTQKRDRQLGKAIWGVLLGWGVILLVSIGSHCQEVVEVPGLNTIDAEQKLVSFILTSPRVVAHNVQAGGAFGRNQSCPKDHRGNYMVKAEYLIRFRTGEPKEYQINIGCFESNQEAGSRIGRISDILEAAVAAKSDIPFDPKKEQKRLDESRAQK